MLFFKTLFLLFTPQVFSAVVVPIYDSFETGSQTVLQEMVPGTTSLVIQTMEYDGSFCAIKFSGQSGEARVQMFNASLHRVMDVTSTTGDFDDCSNGFKIRNGEHYFILYTQRQIGSLGFMESSDVSSYFDGQLVQAFPSYIFTVVNFRDPVVTTTTVCTVQTIGL